VERDLVHRYKEVRLGQLRAFCECARHRSFTLAARALGLTHASVWQQVRALEREYGVAMIERYGREMRPTEDGQVLLELALSVVSSMDALQDAFEEHRGVLPRSLRLVATPDAIVGELCRPVTEFVQGHDRIKLTMTTNSVTQSIFDMIVGGDADLGILPLDERALGARSRIIEAEPLCVRPTVMIVPESHPLARRRRITLADVVKYPLILPERDNPWRLRVEEVLRTRGLLGRLRVLLEISMTQATRRLVSLGLGPALLPLPQDEILFPNTAVHRMGRLLPGELITIVWRRGATLRPQARLFIDFLRAGTPREAIDIFRSWTDGRAQGEDT
jgi:DNA-binding transcriptional LysR family regulator